jgi:hypothetical protein
VKVGCQLDARAQRFEVFARISDRPAHLSNCGGPIKRVVSRAAVMETPIAEGITLLQHGFTQYKKAGGGVYKKTAGDGPATISADRRSRYSRPP